MHIPSLIEKKRDGHALTVEEIKTLISDFTFGDVPDYQMSAWAMAVFFRGMTPAEARHLTEAMMQSGRVFKYPKDSPPKIDKQSTGGVGDKVSLVLAPLLACDQVWVPMICGRGLGITGGTLDKLESIPGFNVNLDDKRALKQLDKIGVFMIGQTEDICPADKKLYALRDVTGTVPSQPLIVASIMSKKLAENLDRLVLDVKFGRGAFMKTKKDAEQLAAAMTEVGASMGVKTTHLLSPMDEPLGRAVGNALEVAECVEILQGGGPPDVVKLIVDLAEKVSETPRAKLKQRLKDGSAWKKFVALVYAQDGDATALEKMTEVHRAPVLEPLRAKSAGRVKKMDAGLIGRASVLLGAGRQRTGDMIDFAVGFSDIKKLGEYVDLDEPLLTVHARNEQSLHSAMPLLEKAIAVG
ncbi:MAG TPA: thymidine phosphorylase [Chthoniobacterales bacterium]|nr:thymidine phosphorylase [Chthoniobacterales bacterium]